MAASPAPFEVRVATDADLQRAGRVVADAYLSLLPVSEGYLEQLLDAAGRASRGVLLVAVCGEEVLGSLTYAAGGTALAQQAGADQAELRMLGVAPSARGRGVAAALVGACLDRARAEGRSAVLLSTQPQMVVAQRLYERLGFEHRPERDWVPEPGVELLAYELRLG